MRLRSLHAPYVVLAVLTLLGTVPLLLSPYPPSMDWPQHVAVVDVLTRLWRGEASVAQHYVFAPQAVGYHLFYLLSFPLALLVGAKAAVQAVMLAVLTAHVGICAWWLHRHGQPVLFGTAGLVSFYGAHFTYGFVVTMVATPLMFLLVASLARGPEAEHAKRTWRRAFALVACAAAVTFGHVVFVPLVVATALLAVAWHGRRASYDAAWVLLGSGGAALPGLVTRALGGAQAAAASRVTFDTFKNGFWHLKKWSVAIDQSWAHAGLLLFVGSCVAASVWPRKVTRVAERGILCSCVALCTASVWGLPYHTTGPVGESLLLNVRWLCMLPWLLVLLVGNQDVERRPSLRLGLEVAFTCAALLVVGGAVRLSAMYAADTRAYLQTCGSIAKGARMGAHDDIVTVGEPWPTVRFNMSFMAFPGRLSAHYGLFVGGHLPLAEVRPGQQARQQKLVQRFAAAVLRADVTDAARVDVWRDCDVVLLQGGKVDALGPQNAAFGRQLAKGRGWRLIAAPVP